MASRAYLLLLLHLVILLPALADIDVKIGLRDSSVRVYLSANKDYSVKDLSSKKVLVKKAAKAESLIRFGQKTNDKLVIASEPDLTTSSEDILLECDKADSDCIWTIKDNKFAKANKRYRGAIIIKANNKDFTVINKVKLEDYLKGVVPSEMPSGWSMEALKAQSVAARTYTISKLNRRANLGYDLKPSVEDQVYLGLNHEHPRTNQAIKATESLVLVDQQKKPVEAFFYSQAGFATASPDYVWGIEPHAYLRPRIFIDNNQFWQKHFSPSSLNIKLSDLKFSSLKAITVLNKSPEGRAREVLVSGYKDSVLKHIRLTGEELRHKLGLRSTFFDTKISKDNISFVGKGFGHGIGMSQYGANKMAQQGKSFKNILSFYYPGASLQKL